MIEKIVEKIVQAPKPKVNNNFTLVLAIVLLPNFILNFKLDRQTDIGKYKEGGAEQTSTKYVKSSQRTNEIRSCSVN